MSLTHFSGRLEAYQRLCRWLYPRKFTGQAFLLTFITAHLPLIGLLGYLMLTSDRGTAELLIVLVIGIVTTLVGIGLSLFGLWVLLAPLAIAAQTLDDYRRTRVHPALPVGLDGQGGQLLTNLQYTLSHLDMVIAQLEESASHDELTGLFNRREGERRLRENLAARHNAAWRLAVLVLDADGMKEINDRWGHQAGDSCIRHLATVIGRRIGADGWVARWGGDEFVAVFREADGHPSAESVLGEINQELSEAAVLLPSGDDVRVVLSAGIARAEPDDDARSLLERADAALYDTKRGRRTMIGITVDQL